MKFHGLSTLSQHRACAVESSPNGPADLDTVLDDWLRREAVIPPLAIRWSSAERLRVAPAAPMEPDDAVKGAGAIPQVVELTTACELAVDDDRFRYFRSGDRWSRYAHRLGITEEVRVRREKSTLFVLLRSQGGIPRGIIEAGPPVVDIFMHTVHTLAPKLVFRPLNPAFRTMSDSERLRLTEQDEFVDDHRCVVLEQIQPVRGRGEPPRIRHDP